MSDAIAVRKTLLTAPIMVFAHITGPSGAGKTHIGHTISSMYIVKDIDDFINNVNANEATVDKIGAKLTTTQFIEQWFARVIKSIRTWVDHTITISNLPIVFVGLSLIYTDIGTLFLPIKAQWVISIDISINKLVRQFIMRDLKIMCGARETALKNIMEGMYDGRWSKEKIKSSKKIIETLYKRRGYISMTSANAVKLLVRLRDSLNYLSFDFITALMPPALLKRP